MNNEFKYSKHCLERMTKRKISAEQIACAVNDGTRKIGLDGNYVFKHGNFHVVIDMKNKVIVTVYKKANSGKHRRKV